MSDSTFFQMYTRVKLLRIYRIARYKIYFYMFNTNKIKILYKININHYYYLIIKPI